MRKIKREKHELYEASVQSPEADIQFFDRAYRQWNGSLPRVLREDFCGTAAVCAAWVRRRPENLAVGIDLHLPTLEHGRMRHIEPLGPRASRVTLVEADVRAVREPKVDLAVALNFSYMALKTRDSLRDYFHAVRDSLAPGGVFVLDIFGGWEAQALKVEKRRVAGFTYVWEQASFDPISHDSRFYIHFRFPDETEMKRAFTYDWRLWTIPEVRELLQEAGFAESRVYWEGTDHRTRNGNGIFRRTTRVDSCPGWIAYVAAGLAPARARRPRRGRP
jgi:SAM-dependent methyltransferase